MTPDQGRQLYELCQNILMKGMLFEGEAGDKFRTMKVLDKRLYETIQNLVEKPNGQGGTAPSGPRAVGNGSNQPNSQRAVTGGSAANLGVPPGTVRPTN